MKDFENVMNKKKNKYWVKKYQNCIIICWMEYKKNNSRSWKLYWRWIKSKEFSNCFETWEGDWKSG